jgi:hypothetical protein
MTDEGIWMYLLGKKVKHRFYDITQRFSICGISTRWYNPTDWQKDKAGLENKRPCGRCERVIRRG